jgi:hypothetical protein
MGFNNTWQTWLEGAAHWRRPAGRLLAQVLTDSSVDDGKTGVEIIKRTKGKLSSVTGDAAYDTVAIYNRASSRGAKVVVPTITLGIGHKSRTKIIRTRQDDSSGAEARAQGVEEEVGLPQARHRRELLL